MDHPYHILSKVSPFLFLKVSLSAAVANDWQNYRPLVYFFTMIQLQKLKNCLGLSYKRCILLRYACSLTVDSEIQSRFVEKALHFGKI
jgi:hypothetical protein